MSLLSGSLHTGPVLSHAPPHLEVTVFSLAPEADQSIEGMKERLVNATGRVGVRG